MAVIVEAHAELWRYPLAVPAGGSGVRSVDLLVAHLTDAAGRPGLGFSYVIDGADALPLAALLGQLERYVVGTDVDRPEALWQRIAAGFNRTGGGPYRTALAAIDVACWDRYAVECGLPLGAALGGIGRRVPAYGSGGFRAHQSPGEAAETARAHVARGLRAVKPRAAGTPADGALLEAVAAATGAALMVDANERCSALAAERLTDIAADLGALFVEEPLPAGDVAGYRALARRSRAPLACGEHLRSLAAAEPFVHDRLCAVLQPDLQALGGLTPSLALARLAGEHGIAIAPHVLPGLFVHLAAAAPNLTWLEDFPLLEPLLTGLPALAADGTFGVEPRPGHGIGLDPEARTAYRIAHARAGSRSGKASAKSP